MAEMSALRGALETLARQSGADVFGVADLAPAREFIATQAKKVNWPSVEKVVVKFPRAVSLGIGLSSAIVDTCDDKLSIAGSPYGNHIYQIVSPHLDTIALQLTGLLQKNGYQAFPVTSSLPVATEGVFSHKLAGHLAGLGWIGKSCLFVSPTFGPRIRLATVLTDAPIEAGAPLDKRCGKCRDCVDACPVEAFTGVEFRTSDAREVRFDAPKCMNFRHEPGTRITRACGLCVAACPIGKRRARVARKEAVAALEGQS